MTTTPLIEVSDLASEKLEEILNEQGETGALLRMMVVPGPHGSFQYMLGMEREAKVDDLVIDAPGVQVLVDPESAPLVEGAQIDYVDGLMRSQASSSATLTSRLAVVAVDAPAAEAAAVAAVVEAEAAAEAVAAATKP